LWKRLRGKRSSQLLLASGFVALMAVGMAWVYAYPAGYRACESSETRDFLARTLVEKGFGVECRKENRQDVALITKFPLRNFNQFMWWAGNQSIATIYEQPGYFWFLRTDEIKGFVTYGF